MTTEITKVGTRANAFTDDVLGTLDATGVAEAIAAGTIGIAEAAAAATARIRTVDPATRAVRWWLPEGGTGPQAPVDAAFYGVPSAIKENTAFAGLPTTMGSAALPATPAKRSGPVGEQFAATGVNVLASTVMPEFGMTASAEFADRAPARNPWNTDYTVGGSSSGSAALVASGALPIAHGNDGGGSIRIPAALNGLVGLKGTRGRLAELPALAVLPVNVVCEGVLTRTVRDTARYFAAAERHRRNPALPPVGHVRGPGRRRRIGLVTESVTAFGIAAECLAPVRTLADELTDQGHEIVELSMADLRIDGGFVDDFLHYWGLLAGLEVAVTAVEARGRSSFRALDPVTRSLLRSGLRGAPSIPGAIARLRAVTGNYERMFVERGVDAMFSPTMTSTTPRIGHLDPALPFDEFMSRTIAMVGITPLNNVSGGPAISVPCGFDGAGLPLGAQFAGPAGTEAALLELAYEVEELRPFARIDG
ncbi:amidase [Tsukamurella ocularis]|uniref:amidase n=1 Tax=Tsukamurella ocularis TaxID=1970234 RepID=UPI002168ED01|nr:amidase [Tsukamurella ocularis]MCS3781146.1 amidase [Tsukamurella ocularis]MCS3786970.1 amidase [Tsukamurella ocularis]MCS3850812.1 amidase [Tsukamurella ocularis]